MKLKKRQQKSRNRLLIVDGEIFCYAYVTNSKYMTEVETKNQEFYNMLDMKEVRADLKNRLNELMVLLKGKEMVLVFGPESFNFRKKILPTYKANRKPTKPLGYWNLVQWCKENYTTIDYDGLEADDVMGIIHTSPDIKKGMESVMISSDKDMKQIPGLFFNHTHTETKPTTITLEEAVKWWMMQALMGDKCDGYDGLAGYGPVKAGKIIDEAISNYGTDPVKIFLNAVVPEYEKNGKTKQEALVQTQMARICTADDIDILPDGTWKHEVWGQSIFTVDPKKGMHQVRKLKLGRRK